MPRDMRVLSIFVASPGGVSEERDAVEAVAARLNSSIGRIQNININVRRYEHLIGNVGNPQEQINTHADDSDVFIGIVHRRWGSDTGNGFDSGFNEEFSRALRRWQQSGAPRIGLFFKEVDAESIRDPGEQLQKVLNFKREIEEQHVAFYNSFTSAPELQGLVTSLIAEELARLAAVTVAPEGQGALPAGRGLEEPPAGREPISTELAEVVSAFAEALAGRPTGNKLDVDRFELFGLSVSRDSDRVPTHLANRLFTRRQELRFIRAELLVWLKEYCRDLGRSANTEQRVIPFASVAGFAWISETLEEYALEFVAVDDANLQIGVMRLMRRLHIRPRNFWPRWSAGTTASDLADIWNSLAEASRGELVLYWLSVRKKRDVERAELLATREEALGDVGRCLVELLNPAPQAGELLKIDPLILLDPLVESLFSAGSAMQGLSDTELAKLADRSYLSYPLRASALRELAERDVVPDAMILGLFGRPLEPRWRRVSDEILLDREVGPNFTRSITAALGTLSSGGPGSEERERNGDVVAILARKNPEVSAAFTLTDLDGVFEPENFRWRLLRLHGNPSMRPQALGVLNRTDNAYKVFLESMDTLNWKPRVRRFVKERIDLSALTYLTSLPADNQQSKLLNWIRALARDQDSLFSRQAARLLAPFANDQDLDLIFEHSYDFEDPENITAQLLRRASLKRLREYCFGRDERLARLALLELEQRDRMPSNAQLKSLLRSPLPEIRILALKKLTASADSDYLLNVEREYVAGTGIHYYNVICELDDLYANSTLAISASP